MGGTQVWKSRVWTPEEIIQTYGPATWAQDGSWGYRTPIYMLNRIIRLQAILEKVSNQTALVFEHISDQLTQTRTVIYQIRLAVDYLLADEGGICGKFNSSECCLEIDDKSEVIKNISKEIRKLAYVGNQETQTKGP
uniref:Envelope protein n=1 Tax=Serinus canaria TaxID=9135 RepID=A0A8C9NHK8_SERCA